MAIVFIVLRTLTLRAPVVVPVLNVVDRAYSFTLRLGLIGTSTASVQDAQADSLGWKDHNLYRKLYRRHW